MADDPDRPFGDAAQSRFIDALDRRPAPRLANDARMQHAVEHHVVQKHRLAKNLGGKIDARRILPDDAIVARVESRCVALRRAAQVDRGGERPVIVTGGRAFSGNGTIVDRQIAGRIAKRRRRMVDE